MGCRSRPSGDLRGGRNVDLVAIKSASPAVLQAQPSRCDQMGRRPQPSWRSQRRFGSDQICVAGHASGNLHGGHDLHATHLVADLVATRSGHWPRPSRATRWVAGCDLQATSVEVATHIWSPAVTFRRPLRDPSGRRFGHHDPGQTACILHRTAHP